MNLFFSTDKTKQYVKILKTKKQKQQQQSKWTHLWKMNGGGIRMHNSLGLLVRSVNTMWSNVCLKAFFLSSHLVFFCPSPHSSISQHAASSFAGAHLTTPENCELTEAPLFPLEPVETLALAINSLQQPGIQWPLPVWLFHFRVRVL